MESADKPGSVVDSHSSGTRVATRLGRPTREPCGSHDRSPIWACSRWGLPCRECCHPRGSLLPQRLNLHGPPDATSADVGGVFVDALSVNPTSPGITTTL